MKNLAVKLTSIFETSTPDLQWGVCVTLADGHGYSAGIIQFTTGTGSVQQVIAAYNYLSNPDNSQTPNNEFTPYNSILNSIASQAAASSSPVGSISGLDGFCDAWKRASQKKEMRQAQLQVLDSL